MSSRRERGEYVYELVNEGAGMTGLRIGQVVSSGPKTFGILWESGHRNRYVQGYYLQMMDFRGWSPEEKQVVFDRIRSHMKPSEGRWAH